MSHLVSTVNEPPHLHSKDPYGGLLVQEPVRGGGKAGGPAQEDQQREEEPPGPDQTVSYNVDRKYKKSVPNTIVSVSDTIS